MFVLVPDYSVILFPKVPLHKRNCHCVSERGGEELNYVFSANEPAGSQFSGMSKMHLLEGMARNNTKSRLNFC